MQKNTLNVLIVDDDQATAKMLGKMIESLGHTVTVTSYAVDAVRLARKLAADMIIVDERMPGVSGSEILATLARLQPSTFRVLTSALLDGPQLASIINQSRLEYMLMKPCRLADVEALLRTAQNERRAPQKVPSCMFFPLARDERGAIVLEA